MKKTTKKEVLTFLKKHTPLGNAALEVKLSVFGDMSAIELNEFLKKENPGIDSWAMILGTFKRMFK